MQQDSANHQQQYIQGWLQHSVRARKHEAPQNKDIAKAEQVIMTSSLCLILEAYPHEHPPFIPLDTSLFSLPSPKIDLQLRTDRET